MNLPLHLAEPHPTTGPCSHKKKIDIAKSKESKRAKERSFCALNFQGTGRIEDNLVRGLGR